MSTTPPTPEADPYRSLQDADQLIRDAKDAIGLAGIKNRELSLVLTKLDEALMWLAEHLTRANPPE